jgi:glycosidase
VNGNTLHSVTNYHLHKALFSGHNDHNYFEIAHTVKRLNDMAGGLKLYNFTDNHDVERIYTKLNNKKHYIPVHILLYTLPGIPSIYYGSEFAIEGKKEYGSDYSLRPHLKYEDYKDAIENNPYTSFISALGKIRNDNKALSYGDFRELLLTNCQYVFSRNIDGQSVIVCVNNSDEDKDVTVKADGLEYKGALFREKISNNNGIVSFKIKANSGEIWISGDSKDYKPLEIEIKEEVKEEPKREEKTVVIRNVSFDEMTIEELQQGIIDRMAKNGPVTDQMKKDVYGNNHHGSLINWIKSFR